MSKIKIGIITNGKFVDKYTYELINWLKANNSNFNFEYCDKMWDSLDGTNCTIGTIKYYAQRDNKKKYNSIMKSKIENDMNINVESGITHHDIARAMYDKFGTTFVCSSIKFKSWWQFENHIWSISGCLRSAYRIGGIREA